MHRRGASGARGAIPGLGSSDRVGYRTVPATQLSGARVATLWLAALAVGCQSSAGGAGGSGSDGGDRGAGAGDDGAGDDGPSFVPTLTLNEIGCHDSEWIEIANPGSEPVPTAGFRLVHADWPQRLYDVPEQTVPPGGLALLRRQTPSEDGFTFPVVCGSAELSLLRPDETVADTVELPVQMRAYTFGRLPDGEGEWSDTTPTPGTNNQPVRDDAALIYDAATVVEIELGLDAAASDALALSPYEYVLGTLRIAAPAALATDEIAVGIRLKGVWGSFRTLDDKAAFRIDVDRFIPGARVHGIEHFVLNNMVQDPAMLHEAVAYRLFRAMALPAPRTGYAWVRVNGLDYGLYANIEDYDDQFLDRHFPSTQHLYEGEYGADVLPGTVLDIDEGDSDDLDDLEALQAAAVGPPETWITGMQPVADLEQMRRVWATEIFIGHWDGYAATINNYFLHSNDGGVFRMLPWGTDQTFDNFWPFGEGGGVLFVNCRASAECFLGYASALADVVRTVDAFDYDAWIAELQTVLTPYVDLDPRRPYTAMDVAAAVARTRDFLPARRAEAEAWLGCLLGRNPDADGDGELCNADCDDGDPSVFHGAEDLCGDGIDQDCDSIVDNGRTCPDCWPLAANGRTYQMCATPRPWDDARLHCEALGASLLVLDDPAEEDGIVAALPDFAVWNVWIGVTDAVDEGVWLTVAGVAPTWTPWSAGEPNDFFGEDCAERWAMASWNDLNCAEPRGVVCEEP